MEHYQGGSVSPLVFLLVCILIAAILGLVTLIKYLHRAKCDDCGLRIAGWNAATDYGIIRLNEPEVAYLAPLCRPCFIRRTVKPKPKVWTHKIR